MRILLVEDEPELRQAIARYLRGLGHAVDECDNGRDAETQAKVHDHDVVILDRMLPDGDSIQLLKKWRRKGLNVPVIFLTARDQVDDRVDGLQSGADDYLVKPFAMQELAARIATIYRRADALEPSVVTVGPFSMDSGRRELRCDGVVIPLRPKEYTLLELLISRRGMVVSKEKIIASCWDGSKEPLSNVEETLVASLRRKLGRPDFIRTIRGSGYLLEGANE